MWVHYHKSLIIKNGGICKGNGLVEISPLISYAGENLNQIIKPGQIITLAQLCRIKKKFIFFFFFFFFF